MPDELFSALEKAKREQGYFSKQELINSCVRKAVLPPNKNKGGRPKKAQFEDAFSLETKESKRIEKEMG